MNAASATKTISMIHSDTIETDKTISFTILPFGIRRDQNWNRRNRNNLGGDEMLAFFFLFNRKAKRATQSNRSAIIDSCASQIVSSAGLRWYVFSRDGILPARVCLLMFYCAMVWKTPILPVVLKRGGRAAISRQKAFFFPPLSLTSILRKNANDSVNHSVNFED